MHNAEIKNYRIDQQTDSLSQGNNVKCKFQQANGTNLFQKIKITFIFVGLIKSDFSLEKNLGPFLSQNEASTTHV